MKVQPILDIAVTIVIAMAVLATIAYIVVKMGAVEKVQEVPFEKIPEKRIEIKEFDSKGK